MYVVNIKTVNYMLNNGMTRDMFYCPSNANQQKNKDFYWEWRAEWDGKKLTGGRGAFTVSGYCFIMELAKGKRPEISNQENKTGPKKWLKTTRDKNTAKSELCIDVVLSMPDSRMKYGENFAMVHRGMLMKHGVYHSTSHLKSDEEPF